MSCESFQSKISTLMDGELTGDESALVFAHLAGCDPCRTFFHNVQALSVSLDRMAGLPVLPRAMTFAPSRHMPEASWWHRRVSFRYPALVAASALVCAVVLFSWKMSRQTGPVYVTTLPTVVVAADRNTR